MSAKSSATLQIGQNLSRISTKYRASIPDSLKRLPRHLEFGPGVNLVVGPNGSGKSTFIEGILYNLLARKHDVSTDELLRRAPDEVAFRDNMSIIFAKALDVSTNGLSGFSHIDYTLSAMDSFGLSMEGRMNSQRFMRLSQRQSREALADRKLKSISQEQPQALLIDEPEHGLDPWRHADIANLVGGLATAGSIVLVATNSPLLVIETALPRIDLRTPEQGVI
jgi:predicted ATPase